LGSFVNKSMADAGTVAPAGVAGTVAPAGVDGSVYRGFM
jgi:hypothetical protein